jgi:hypothetical protein
VHGVSTFLTGFIFAAMFRAITTWVQGIQGKSAKFSITTENIYRFTNFTISCVLLSYAYCYFYYKDWLYGIMSMVGGLLWFIPTILADLTDEMEG